MAENNTDRIWVTWETQRRNAELSQAFNCQYIWADYSKQPTLNRYLCSAVETLVAVVRCRPKVVFVQCPSVVLVIFATVLSYIFRYRVVVDCHNGGIESLQRSSAILRQLLGWAFRKANLVIVSNTALIESLPAVRAKALPDKLPVLHRGGRSITAEAQRPVVTIIASYAPDEPLQSLLQAIKDDHRFTFFVTGRRSRAGELVRYESEHIRFTDFLAAADYDQLLVQSDLLIDLTTRDNCLVCGAYEAISAGVPAILSDSSANRSLFTKGFIYSENTPPAYQAALAEYLSNADRLKREIIEFKPEFEQRWSQMFTEVNQAVAESSSA